MLQIERQNPKLQLLGKYERISQGNRETLGLWVDQHHLARSFQVGLPIGEHLVEVGLAQPALTGPIRSIEQLPLGIHDPGLLFRLEQQIGLELEHG